jgi:hypothetical protein
MPESDRVIAVAKLNKGASDGIRGAVKAKVLSALKVLHVMHGKIKGAFDGNAS